MSFLGTWAGTSGMVGLDIGASSLKVAQLKSKKNSYSLETLAHIGLPKGTVVDGDILDALTLEESIKELFSKEKIQTKSVAFAVSGSSVLSKRISIPTTSEAELEEQISVIASQYIPFPIEDLNIDYQILPSKQNQAQTTDLVIVAVKKKFLESYISVIEAADLKPSIVDTSATSLANIFTTSYGAKPPLALVHVGAGLTEFIILEDGVATFSKSLLIGGNTISQNIQEKLKLSYAEADALKMSCYKDQNLPSETVEIVQQSCNQIFQEIQGALNTYISQFPQMSIEKIVLSGGTAKIVPFIEWMKEKTGIETTLLNPFQQITYDPKKFSQTTLNELSSIVPIALGLATRGAL